jgi:uncharacterized membrane protein YphA (DoxX/SURF4 family)
MIVLAISMAMAGMLLWAGLEKLRDLKLISSSIRSLGVPSRGAGFVAALVALTEIGVGLGLVFEPDSSWTQTGVVTLAGMFALAGAVALRVDSPIPCSCFGSGGKGNLGSRQIVALGPWLIGAALVRLATQGPWSLAEGAGRLVIVGLALAMLRAISVWRSLHEARGDRRSAQEMFAWLR